MDALVAPPPEKIVIPFRPRARLLQLLGDELIGSPRLAVFELVKNAYDADATEVVVRLELDRKPPTITVTDDGQGMTLETLRDVWMVPGDDHRHRQRHRRQWTPKHRRLPIGEKGLGRFAVHKLGNRIDLITRAAGADECVVTIDWQHLIASHYLDDASVTISSRAPRRFTGDSTGTAVTISDLRAEWNRGEVRRLARQITSICSPFKRTASGFRAVLEVPGQEHMVKSIPNVSTILERAIWTFDFTFDAGVFEWIYDFKGVPGFKVAPRRIHNLDGREGLLISTEGGTRTASNADGKGIGPVTGELYVYDRDKEILSRSPEAQLMKAYLNKNGGIRVYRDGIRVYNYGELEDSWLGLDLRRVNVPTLRISRNIVLGAIHLSLKESPDLVEKTNREGFVENDTLARLKSIVIGALAVFEPERQLDKRRIRQESEGLDTSLHQGVSKMFSQMRTKLDKDGYLEKYRPQLKRIEREYDTMQDVLTKAGMSGLNLALVFHEVERGVRELHHQIVAGVSHDVLVKHAQSLIRLLEGFAGLVRRRRKSNHSLHKLISTAQSIYTLRLARHQIDLVGPNLGDGAYPDSDLHSNFYFHMAVGALNNLIDNAIYWLKVRWPDNRTGARKMYIGISDAFDFGPAVLVADNGIGFRGDDPQDLMRPFFTRRPTGMGLGLYYVNMAMELCGGKCVFPRPGDVAVPEDYDGAVVALLFKGV